MDTYHVVLYIHFLSLFVGVGAASALLVCLLQLRAAQTLMDAVPWGMAAGKITKAFPVAVVGLFATGAYMTSDLWTWGTSWIDVGIVGLAVVALQGPLIAERGSHALRHALQENGPGPLGDHARRMARHRALWHTEFTNVGVVLAIVWNMTEKPDWAGAIAAPVVAYALGAGAAVVVARPSAATEAVEQPAS